MKPYNINTELVTVADFQYSAVTLGESGRGRKLVNLACPETFEFLEPGLTKTMKPRLIGSSSKRGWVARISTNGGYVRGANGNVSTPPEFHDAITVVSRGNGAFGAAGRTGTWDDIVIATELEDFWVRVKPSRGEAYILKFTDTKVHKLTYAEAELLDLDLLDSSATNGRGEKLVEL